MKIIQCTKNRNSGVYNLKLSRVLINLEAFEFSMIFNITLFNIKYEISLFEM